MLPLQIKTLSALHLRADTLADVFGQDSPTSLYSVPASSSSAGGAQRSNISGHYEKKFRFLAEGMRYVLGRLTPPWGLTIIIHWKATPEVEQAWLGSSHCLPSSTTESILKCVVCSGRSPAPILHNSLFRLLHPASATTPTSYLSVWVQLGYPLSW